MGWFTPKKAEDGAAVDAWTGLPLEKRDIVDTWAQFGEPLPTDDLMFFHRYAVANETEQRPVGVAFREILHLRDRLDRAEARIAELEGRKP